MSPALQALAVSEALWHGAIALGVLSLVFAAGFGRERFGTRLLHLAVSAAAFALLALLVSVALPGLGVR